MSLFCGGTRISTKTKINNQSVLFKNELLKHWEEAPPYFFTSASTALGRDELLNYIEEAAEQYK